MQAPDGCSGRVCAPSPLTSVQPGGKSVMGSGLKGDLSLNSTELRGSPSLCKVEQRPLKIHIHLEPQTVALFGNKVFADVIRMRSYWVRVGPYPVTGVLRRDSDTRRGEKALRQQRWRDVSTSQAVPAIPGAGRVRKGSSPRRPSGLQREHGPADTLLLDFRPPAL